MSYTGLEPITFFYSTMGPLPPSIELYRTMRVCAEKLIPPQTEYNSLLCIYHNYSSGYTKPKTLFKAYLLTCLEHYLDINVNKPHTWLETCRPVFVSKLCEHILEHVQNFMMIHSAGEYSHELLFASLFRAMKYSHCIFSKHVQESVRPNKACWTWIQTCLRQCFEHVSKHVFLPCGRGLRSVANGFQQLLEHLYPNSYWGCC